MRTRRQWTIRLSPRILFPSPRCSSSSMRSPRPQPHGPMRGLPLPAKSDGDSSHGVNTQATKFQNANVKSKEMNQPQNLKERSGITGTVIVRAHPAGTLDAYAALVNQGKIVEAQNLIKAGDVKVIQKNIIVDSGNYGIDIIVQYLISAYAGSFNFPLGIAWGEIGTGSTTPTVGDTALTTPTNRAPVSYAWDEALNI